MPRRSRVDFDGALHHVMNRGVDHQTIFFGDPDRVEFGRLLGECHERFGLEVLAYCLMGNHYHLVIRTPSANLSETMRHFAATYVRHTNDRVGRDGPLFRGRFVSLPVTTPEYLRDLVRYVHRNPLDIAAIRHPSQYRWSSYRTYLGHRRAPHFLRTDLTMSLFDGDLVEFAGYTEASRRGRDREVAGIEWILSVVRREVAVERLAEPDRAPPKERLLLAALLDVAPDPWREPIDAHLAFTSDEARRAARSRASRRRNDDPVVGCLVNRVLSS